MRISEPISHERTARAAAWVCLLAWAVVSLVVGFQTATDGGASLPLVARALGDACGIAGTAVMAWTSRDSKVYAICWWLFCLSLVMQLLTLA